MMRRAGQTITSTPRTPELCACCHHRARRGLKPMSADLAAEADIGDKASKDVAGN